MLWEKNMLIYKKELINVLGAEFIGSQFKGLNHIQGLDINLGFIYKSGL
jgi:hypothetical protein